MGRNKGYSFSRDYSGGVPEFKNFQGRRYTYWGTHGGINKGEAKKSALDEATELRSMGDRARVIKNPKSGNYVVYVNHKKK